MHTCLRDWEAGKAFLSPLKLSGQIELYNDFLIRKHANNTKSNKQKSKPIYRHTKGKYSFCHFSVRKMFVYWKWFYRFYSIQSSCSIQRIRYYSIGLSCTEARPFGVKNLAAPRYMFGSRQKNFCHWHINTCTMYLMAAEYLSCNFQIIVWWPSDKNGLID